MTQLSLASQYYARLEARAHIINSIDLSISQMEKSIHEMEKSIEVLRLQGKTQVDFVDEDLAHLVATIGFVPPEQKTIEVFEGNHYENDEDQKEAA